MSETVQYDLQAIGRCFRIPGEFVEAAPYGSGHINDTFATAYCQGGTRVRYIHQRINHQIFADPPALMDNISRVTAHVGRKAARRHPNDARRRCLTLVPAVDSGESYVRDDDGNTWRTYVFIEGARTYDTTETEEQEAMEQVVERALGDTGEEGWDEVDEDSSSFRT